MIYIKHNVIIRSNPSVVFRAISTHKGIQGWWTVDNQIDPKLGGIAEFIFGDRYHNKMEITEYTESKKMTWHCLEGDPEWIGTDISFDLEEKDGDTVLRFTHVWREITEFYANCNFQWGKYLLSLKNYCETGTGSPFNPIYDM